METINESSKRIANIIGVIDAIAYQTNILALNAAVEAARAGELGRGFAVVAEEVRNLAQRSAEASKEIKLLITNSLQQVDRGVAAVKEAGQTMNNVVSSVQQVELIVAEINNSIHQQAAGMLQVSSAIQFIDSVTQKNAALVEEAAAGSASIAEEIDRLARMMNVFKLKDVQGVAVPIPPNLPSSAGPGAIEV